MDINNSGKYLWGLIRKEGGTLISVQFYTTFYNANAPLLLLACTLSASVHACDSKLMCTYARVQHSLAKLGFRKGEGTNFPVVAHIMSVCLNLIHIFLLSECMRKYWLGAELLFSSCSPFFPFILLCPS